jgi:hypothetical protein
MGVEWFWFSFHRKVFLGFGFGFGFGFDRAAGADVPRGMRDGSLPAES